jgi:hypothetical protein
MHEYKQTNGHGEDSIANTLFGHKPNMSDWPLYYFQTHFTLRRMRWEHEEWYVDKDFEAALTVLHSQSPGETVETR